MENTKVYAVVANESCGFSSYPNKRILKVLLSKIEAEFEVWRLKKSHRDSFNIYFSFEMVEVPLVQITPGKDFKDFIGEKKENIEKQIKERQECGDKDVRVARELSEEVKDLEEFLKN